MEVLKLDENNFDSEIKSGVVLVDFWAEWCGPCQMMLPILSDFAEEMGDKMKVGKVNVDENPALAQKFRVMSIPTIVVLKDGEMVEQLVGVQQKEVLVDVCSKYL
ncbi:thioredoxin [Candidatus Gracilibacteria bacterium]|nr:MAG: thioredoxin [Candidatus Gracilibacteria bacterium]PIE85635.1 MAG: thioredoxin [Candidatus Gracilibacteria bacterium]